MKISKVITIVFLIYANVPSLCGIAQGNIDGNTIKGMKTHERRYSLREAIKNDNVEFVKSYLDAGFDIDGHLGGKTLLSCAVSAKSMNIIKYLIDQGVDINKMDKRATEHLENPLIYAVRTGDISIVQYLVNNGADITITTPPLGYTALYYAKVEKNDEIMKYLQEKGLTAFQGEPPKSDRPITAQIVSAIAFRRHEDLEKIMKKGAPPDIELSKSYNPLGFAASRNDIKSMEILIKNGANVNDPKHPPLISAIMDSRNFAPSIEPIKMLVENGADVNHVQHGKRPLDYAMLYSNRETEKYLKNKGAKPATKEERSAFNEKYNVKPDMLSSCGRTAAASADVDTTPEADAPTSKTATTQPEPNDSAPTSATAPQPQHGDTKTIDLGGGVTLEMIYIKGGTFEMGLPDAQKERSTRHEGPVHTVDLDGFWMGKYEVTIDQYRAFLRVGGDSSGVRFRDDHCPVQKDASFSLSGHKFGSSPQQPMVEISWDGATKFCDWLSRKTGQTFRLPTEAEWEYACRAGTQTTFYFGDSEADLGSHAWYSDNSDGKTHPVGTKRPNPWGLYDMYGNVWEWCGDWGDWEYYQNSPRKNPTGPPSGKYRTLRGGCWKNEPSTFGSATRGRTDPPYTGSYYGFRVASPSLATNVDADHTPTQSLPPQTQVELKTE